MESQSITNSSIKGSISTSIVVGRVSHRQGTYLRYVLCVTLVALAVMLPIILYGVPNGADLPNHLRFVLPFYESIQSGHFHPGWLAESNYGLGDPRFIFYPPGLYYLLCASRMLTGEWYSASILAFIFLSVTGGLGAYSWARTIFNPSTAMWTGILYTLAPYRLNELYQASLLSEYAACSILPFVFCFVERVCRRKNVFDVVGLAACYALLILTHLPIAVIGSIALAAYALLRIERKSMLPTIARLAVGVTLGLAASSFFWTSMLAELSWIKGNSAGLNPYYDYRLNFLFSPAALTNRNTWYANVLALSVIGFLLPGLALIINTFKQEISQRSLKAALVLLIGSFVMATSLSKPIWTIIPKLSEVQFPWRWLSVTSLMGAILFAASIPKWQEQFRQRIRPRDLAVGLAFTLSLVFIGTQVIQDCDYIGHAKFEPMVQEIRGAVSFKDWLPAMAKEFTNVEKMNAQADAGSRPVTVNAWEPERRSIHLGAGSQSALKVRTYFYPRWTAKADGQSLPVTANPDGLLLITTPTRETDIELDFESPKRVRWSELVTGMSWVLILGAGVFGAISARRRRGSAPGSAAVEV
jgi:6-pyruvoyl-tetrahydropterin synthase related domain